MEMVIDHHRFTHLTKQKLIYLKKITFTVLGIVMISLASFAQVQPKPKSAQTTKTAALEKLLIPSGLPFKMINDSLAVIPYGGENIESFNVYIQAVGDLYIVYTNLTEALPGKIDQSRYSYLLKQNDHFDVIKIGVSEDNIFYVRADTYKSGISAALLLRIIKQVANVTNILGGDLKKE